MNLQSKLPQAEQSIFTIMGKMAHDYNAINLSQGFPDFEMDAELIALVNEAMVQGHNNYAPMEGDSGLRKVISEKVKELHGATYKPETEITVTAGATQAIFTILASMIHQGDEVIIFTPAYDCYSPTIRLMGGTPIPVQLPPPSFAIDWNQVAEKITPKTRMLIVNSPHNPSGTVFSEHDLMALEKLVEKHKLFVLSDEVYEHIVFDGKQHESVARRPALAARSFITASFGKTFHNTGWKIGYCLAPQPLMKEFQKVHQFNVFGVNHPVQKGLAVYLKNSENYIHLSEFYQEKRDSFLTKIRDSAFKFVPASGTYFQLLDYSAISDLDDISFAERLLKKHGLATIPTSVFNEDKTNFKQIRVCFAKKEATLEAAAAVLNKLTKDNF